MATNGTVPGDGRSLGKLVSDLSEQTSKLVHAEVELAKEELAAKAIRAGIGSGLFAAAAVLAAYTLAVGVATVILAIAVALPAWLAALIVFAAMLVVTVVLLLVGRAQLKKSSPPRPARAIENLRKDVAAVKEGLHR
jgi:hypothetical protein